MRLTHSPWGRYRVFMHAICAKLVHVPAAAISLLAVLALLLQPFCSPICAGGSCASDSHDLDLHCPGVEPIEQSASIGASHSLCSANDIPAAVMLSPNDRRRVAEYSKDFTVMPAISHAVDAPLSSHDTVPPTDWHSRGGEHAISTVRRI